MRPTRLLALALALAACGTDPPSTLPRSELLDPETCSSCHPDHYRQWSGSMHAYAANDPVFLAMNARGQRETGGALGDFCVACHAPMAVREGVTTDGLNLADVPRHLKGVTCYFCHQVEAVEGSHNNPLRLANDTTMRGSIADPVPNRAHRSQYAPLLDRRQKQSSDHCGACHDIVLGTGVHLERTFLEWKQSLFGTDLPGQRLTCGECHMTGLEGVAANAEGAVARRVHEHTFAGVDVALTPWPEVEEQRRAIARDLDPAILTQMCVAADVGGLRVEVTLENVLAGHMWPSGAAQDRRAWVELVAYRAGARIYESGVVADDQPVALVADPDLWLLRDRMYDDAGHEVHMFWEAHRVESELLAPPVTNDPGDPRYNHAATRRYRIQTGVPDRITLRVRIRPMGLEVLDDLIASGDLAPEIRGEIPTFSLAGAELEWTTEDGLTCVR